ncbi:hypothetical protein BN1708_018777, partial [Verticillium longisporum]
LRLAPHQHYPPDVRRPRCPASHLQARPFADHVPLHLWLHLQDGRYRGRRHRAPGHLLLVLRPALPCAAPHALRQDACRQDRDPQGQRLAPQHRLGRCRCHAGRQALPSQVHSCHSRRHPLW